MRHITGTRKRMPTPGWLLAQRLAAPGLRRLPHKLSIFWGAILLLCFTLAGCAQPSATCPPTALVDLSGSAAFASDDGLPFQFPVEVYKPFQSGNKTNFTASGNKLAYDGKRHAAEDIGHPAGTPVYAMAAGKISFSGPKGGYGWLIIIDHPQENLYSLYGHLSPSRWRKESGTVEKGELIAYLGDTDENGSSRRYGQISPHLHFGVRAGQRADYPGSGEWRWQAGWVKPCPQRLGWLQPSLVITSQEVPNGGFVNPQAGFLETWGAELLPVAFFLAGALLNAAIWIKKDKPVFLALIGGALVVIGVVFTIRGMRLSYALPAAGLLLAAFGIYRSIQQSRQ